MTTMTTPVAERVHRSSPPLLAVALVFVALCVASVLTSVLFGRCAFFPAAYAPLDVLQDFYTGIPAAIHVAALLQLVASLVLAVFAAAAASRPLPLHVNAASNHIALLGGAVASIFLGLSALAGWALAHPGIDQATVRVVHQLAFASHVAHMGGLALLVGGLSVTSWGSGVIPPWLGFLGALVAALAAVSVLTLALPFLAVLLPLVSVLFWIWLIATVLLASDS